VTGVREAAKAASRPFGVVRPCWLNANGDAQRLEVLRSPLVKSTSRMYEPVRQYIAVHGLVLAAQETFKDFDWMHGAVEMSVYVPAASRNASYAEAVA
jgi:Gene product 70